MFVHRCNPRCVYLKEIQPDRAKYRGIWGILMHKMIFPSESCNSISKGTFHELRPFSVIAENRWPYNTNTFAYPSLGTDGLDLEMPWCMDPRWTCHPLSVRSTGVPTLRWSTMRGDSYL